MSKYMFLLRLFLISLFFSCCCFLSFSQGSRSSDSLLNSLTTAANSKIKTDALNNLSAYYANTETAKSLEYALESYNLSVQEKYDEGRLNACLNLALIYYLKSDLAKAMQYALEAKDLAERLGLNSQLAISLDAIGIIFYEIGDKQKSSEYFYESIRIYEDLKDKNGMGQTYCRIGTLYFDQKEFDKALEYYTRSVQLAREIDSQEGISSNLHNVAKVFAAKKEYKQAIQNYNEAILINRKMGYLRLEGSNYLDLSEVYTNMGDFARALVYIEKARLLFEKLGNQLRIAKCLLSSAEINLKTGNTDKGINSALNALEIAKKRGYRETILDAARILHKAYMNKSDTGYAYRYYLLENQWKDSLSIGERQKTLTKLELQYQFEKNEQKEKIKQQRRTVLVSIIILCLVFSIVIIVLILNHIRLKAKKSLLEKESLEKELEFKKKELTINVLSLMKKNEFISDISEKLLSLAKESGSPDTKSAIRKIGRELQKGQEDELWKEFTLRFKEVHSDFYNTLISKYPNLSPNEQKLCAFLRLNMTSKEISELTGQSVSTIEIARHRLRQKLGINSSDINLITFLSQL
jgi:tetratricopeptide (TPR) repeat protein